jgi:hypothetical protein
MLMGYIEHCVEKIFATEKAVARLKDFIDGLSAEERRTLAL